MFPVRTNNIAKSKAVNSMPSTSVLPIRLSGNEVEDYGVAVITLILYLVLATYFIAYTMPAALVTLSTVAFTSVNAGVTVIFQTLVPLAEGFVIILAFIGLVRKIMA